MAKTKKRAKKTKEDLGYYSKPAGPAFGAKAKIHRVNSEKYKQGWDLAMEHLAAAKKEGIKHPRVLGQEKIAVQALGHKDTVKGYRDALHSKRKKR